jgi:TonB dependent receptor/Carboxypeptidase regulatory-like domain
MRWMGRAFGPSTAIIAVSVMMVAPVRAQQGAGVLIGRVQDAATQKSVADVVVTVSSPSMQGEQVVVTDSAGEYRVPNLPPGNYSIRLEKEAYKPYVRPAIGLRADTTIRVDAALLPEALKAEEVVVTARPPTVDVGSTTTGLNVNSDVTKRVPVGAPGTKGGGVRSFEAVAELAPGAHTDNFGTSISGTTSPENQYVIDGMSVNNPANGIIGAPLSVEFVKEVSIITGGYMPEYGRATGGILNVVTKSGSNEFHGSVWGFMSPGFGEGPRKVVRRQGTTIQTQQALSSSGDMGFDLGGPIIKDKLWFYTGFQVAETAYTLNRSLNSTTLDNAGNPVVQDGYNVTERIPGTEQRYLASSRDYQTFGKLTYSVDEQNRLILSVFATPSTSGGNGSFGINPADGQPEDRQLAGTYNALAHKYTSTSFNTILKWTTESKNKKVLLDTTVGWHHAIGGTSPSDGSEPGSGDGLAGVPSVSWRRSNPGPHSIRDFENFANADRCDAPGSTSAVRCPVATYSSGGPDFLDSQTLDRYQAKSVLTYFAQGLGHHVIKGGVDVEMMEYDHLRAYSGTRRLRESTSGTSFSENRMFGYLKGPDDPVILDSLRWKTNAVTVGGFVQDSWSILDKVTVNLGVRYDAQVMFGGDGRLGLSLPNQWSPRLGVIYDPTQSGRSKLFAHYARFYENVPLGIADRAQSGEPQIQSSHRASSCNPRDPSQLKGDCLTDVSRTSPGTTSSPDKKWGVTGGGAVPIDPDIKPQSSDEALLGAEYDVIKDGRVGVSYTKRWMNNVIEDMSRDDAQTYFIGNPGSGIAKDFPEAVRDYDALTLSFQKLFADQWLAHFSYTLSSLRGNYSGLFRPENNQLDPNINSDFDLRSLLANRTGPLPADRTHQFKMFGAKDFNLPDDTHITFGGTARARSGEPTSYLGSHPLYGFDEAFILPRGSGERMPWVFGLDAHVGYGIKIAKDKDLTVSLDIFNLFNFQAETSRDQRYTGSDVLPIPNGNAKQLPGSVRTTTGAPFNAAEVNPNFGKATAYQPPRYFRFGIRTTF